MEINKIILIDDDRTSMDPVYNILRLDFEVKWVQDLNEFDENEVANNYHAVILDIMMSTPESWNQLDITESQEGMQAGKVVFKKIRSIKSEIPILVYSATTCDFIDNYAAYLAKPDLVKNIVEKLKFIIK